MKAKAKVLAAALAAGLLLGAVFASCGSAPAEGGGETAVIWTVHYQRAEADYDGWDLWLWPTQPNGEGKGYTFGAPDEENWVTAGAELPDYVTEIGVIVRQGGDGWAAKDIEDDRFATSREIWLISGDETIYTEKPSAE
jgi:pullulanase